MKGLIILVLIYLPMFLFGKDNFTRYEYIINNKVYLIDISMFDNTEDSIEVKLSCLNPDSTEEMSYQTIFYSMDFLMKTTLDSEILEDNDLGTNYNAELYQDISEKYNLLYIDNGSLYGFGSRVCIQSDIKSFKDFGLGNIFRKKRSYTENQTLLKQEYFNEVNWICTQPRDKTKLIIKYRFINQSQVIFNISGKAIDTISGIANIDSVYTDINNLLNDETIDAESEKFKYQSENVEIEFEFTLGTDFLEFCKISNKLNKNTKQFRLKYHRKIKYFNDK